MNSQDQFSTPPHAHYKQPVPNMEERSLSGSFEFEDFIPKSHMRIYYNTQVESYAMHYHNAMEIVICIENQYDIITNSGHYTLNEGDILIIPPLVMHELLRKPYGARFIFLIDIDMLKCFQDFKALEPIFMVPYLCNADSHPEIYEHVHSSLLKMADIYFSHDIFWETSIYAILLDIIMSIGRDYFSNKTVNKNSLSSNELNGYHEIFINLLNFIDTHYAEDLTLEQMAKYSDFSKYHFSRLFKKYTNTTFHDYLCHKRIHAAQSMLTADGNIPITNVAFQVGFNNLTTFGRCFQKYTNCSPTEYRSKFYSEENC